MASLPLIPILFGTFASSAERSPVLHAVERALPYLEEEGTWWIEKKQCASCHHTTFLVWAKELAFDAGLGVSEEMLKEQRSWMWQSFLEEVDEDTEDGGADPKPGEIKGERNVEGVSQFLLSPASEHAPEEIRSKLLSLVQDTQRQDGSWKPGGQLPRQERPTHETGWVSNQWSLLALKKGGRKPTHKSETWREGGSAVTSEWWMLNLLMRPGNPATARNFLRLQNEDGSWSWKPNESGSPSATGQALIALGRTGLRETHLDAVAGAQKFLLQTQSEDGHWETMSTKDRTESTRVSDFWGTAWAVIGLLESSQ